MNLTEYGILRVASVTPRLHLANPKNNTDEILERYENCVNQDCAVVVTPELSLTGYSCEDLFNTRDLHEQTEKALVEIARATKDTLLIVGAPCVLPDHRRLNCAFACADGKILGAVPKIAIPNHEEYYEQRWFTSGLDIEREMALDDMNFRVTCNQLFQVDEAFLGIELCEDLWVPQPPSSSHALAGATIIANLSASPELVSKSDYRRDLVRMQSARCLAAYVYSGAGIHESSKDVVFGGHKLIAENAAILAESTRLESEASTITADIDWRKLEHHRKLSTTFTQAPRTIDYRYVRRQAKYKRKTTTRHYSQHPFVPKDERELDARAREIMMIQATGLARRFESAHVKTLVVGVSGGIDSTLALLVCCDAIQRLNLSNDQIIAITMKGAGTTSHTRKSVDLLTQSLNLKLKEILIVCAVESHLDALDHDGSADVVFENSQARERTQILFDMANKVNGIVVGSGDLSEIALGWCTFTADQMSGYNVNVGVPKTLVTYIVRWYAQHRADASLREALERVLDTEFTPELMPTRDDRIVQATSAIIGPYDLHDFFLYHLIRTGASIRKILTLADIAFSSSYDQTKIAETLNIFVRRFYAQQFKRITLPPGPKVGTVSLSPRGDWRMPDEVQPSTLISEIHEFTQHEI